MQHLSMSVLVQHLLFLFLVLIAPLWEYPSMRRLKRESTEARKLGIYKLICAWLWMASVVAIAAVGWRPLFTIDLGPNDVTWVQHTWVRTLIEIIVVLFAVALLLPMAIVLWKQLRRIPRKYASADAMKSLSFFLPATWSERRWWAVLSITAGICEELLFRGFLLRYLHSFPLTLNFSVALLIAAVAFGVHHLYQGFAALFSTALIATLFALLFVVSGTLLLPILLHVAMDIRMLWMVRPPAQARSAAAL